MTPNDIQVSRSKVSVEGQAYSNMFGKGGISVLQTAIFVLCLTDRKWELGLIDWCQIKAKSAIFDFLKFSKTIINLKVYQR